jgi:histidine triad (HIT) family protein
MIIKMTNNCIFCKIANKEIKTDLILETEDYVSFNDMSPQAPFHAIVIPKQHFSSLNDVENTEIMGKLLDGARKTAEKLGIKENFRIVINTGKEAGQTVFHIHLHVLGGRQMNWPPG